MHEKKYTDRIKGMKKLLLSIILCTVIIFSLTGEVSGSQAGSMSPVERAYNSRLPESDVPLTQIGYDLFGNWIPTVTNTVDDSYVFGSGDKLRIYLWGDPVDYGAVLSSYDMEVDADGSIFIKPVGRVSVYGRTIPQIEGILAEKFAVKYKDINLEVTPLQLRNFSVYVSGFSARPGAVTVSNLWSAADILGVSGGVLPEGSLRSIRILRNGETLAVDLYDLLADGSRGPVDVRIREGDVVYVPPIGRTAAVVGDVRRPGIYELAADDTIADVLKYAGGTGFAGAKPLVKLLRMSENGSVIIDGAVSSESFISAKVEDGDIFLLQSGTAPVSNLIKISGPVRNPGFYTASSVPTLTALLAKAELLPETDTLTAIITRKEINREEEKIIFSPGKVLSGEADIQLKPNDAVEFFKSGEGSTKNPILVTSPGADSQYVPFVPGITLLDILKGISLADNPAGMEARILREAEVIDQIVLREILVRGKTDLNRELAAGDKIILLPLENSASEQGVKILGQVAVPGVYPLIEGAAIYDMIVLAGGYTDKAFPQGAVMNRVSVQEKQIEQFKISIQKTQESLTQLEGALAYQNLSDDAEIALKSQISSQKALLDEAEERLGDGFGRIILTLPPTLRALQLGSGYDNIQLQEGDTLYIPEQPMTISIFGDIGTAAALPWVPDKTVKKYLLEVGGLRSRDYSLSIVKQNGKIITPDSLFFGLTTIENLVLEQGDAVIAVKRLSLPASTAFLESLSSVTDTVYKILYSLDAVGIL